MRKRTWNVLVTMLALVTASCCEYLRSSRAPLSTTRLADSDHRCVLVMLPGIGDSPSLFDEHDFERIAGAGAAPCDVVSVDSHFAYYRDAVVANRMAAEVLEPMRDEYQQVWLVGVSLGGYGAVLTAKERPDLVDGVVLISPFLGVKRSTRALVERIGVEGGLTTYEPAPVRSANPRRHFVEVEPVWAWLAARARNEPGPRIMMVWGAGDGFALEQRTVGEALGAERGFAVDGAHDWDTFARAWHRVVQRAPWAVGDAPRVSM